MGKGATLRQGSKGPKLKLVGTTHGAQEIIHTDLHQEDGVCPSQSSTPHTHISRTPPHLLGSQNSVSFHITKWG